MKKNLFFILITMGVSLSSALAQVGTGKIFLGGGFSISQSSTKDINGGVTVVEPVNNSFSLSPRGQYFTSDKLAAGAGIGLEIYSSKQLVNGNADEEIDRGRSFFINPYVRYYHSFSETLYAFAEGGFFLGSGSSETELLGVTVDGPKTSQFSLYVAPGLSFFPTEKFAIDFRLNLLSFNNSTSIDPANSANKIKNPSFNFGFSTFAPSIGIYYVL